jgi:TM2 domain-containing membrane protein YozV
MSAPKPANPYLVLLASLVLPGSGQVMNRQPVRGLVFLFFMVLLGGYTLKTAAPEVSIIGKFAGGIFVYAMSIFDAYRHARIRFEVWQHARQAKDAD